MSTYGERTNRDNAESARAAVEALGFWGQNDPETDLGDFICNLRHLCRLEGWDWETVLNKAEYHYAAESPYGWDEEVPA